MLEIAHEYLRNGHQNCKSKKATFGEYVIAVLGPVPYLLLLIFVFRALLLVIFVVSRISFTSCNIVRCTLRSKPTTASPG